MNSWNRRVVGVVCVLVAAVLAGGCGTTKTTPIADEHRQPYTAVGVQPGDTLVITFPAAPSMNTTQQVQSDGTVAMPLGGSLEVKGKTAPEVERAVLGLYGDQLVVKEVSVSISSAGFPVFVSGAVLRQGRVQLQQSVTLLEAIVSAGGFVEGRADLRKVRVVRNTGDGRTTTHVVDVRRALEGDDSDPFYMRPGDVVFVPERFSFY